MKGVPYRVRAKVWLYQGDSPWHFVTIPKKEAEEIKKEYMWPRRGFGAIPVHVTIGKTIWKTSIFPDKDRTYLLPLKKDIRLREEIHAGSTVNILLKVLT